MQGARDEAQKAGADLVFVRGEEGPFKGAHAVSRGRKLIFVDAALADKPGALNAALKHERVHDFLLGHSPIP